MHLGQPDALGELGLGPVHERSHEQRRGCHESADDCLDDAAPTGLWTWTSESYPADAVSLRSVSSDNFVVVDTTHDARVIGETDFTSGPSTLHEKAIYIVEGQLFQVDRFDFDGRKAYVTQIDPQKAATTVSPPAATSGTSNGGCGQTAAATRGTHPR